jgi:hypothetical protein
MKIITAGTLSLMLCVSAFSRLFDLQQFMSETQRVKQDSGAVSIVWWVPTVYWENAMAQNPALSTKQKEEVLSALEPYLMFVVARMEAGVLGTMKAQPRSAVIDAFDLKFNAKTIDVVRESDLSPEIRNLIRMFKPLFAGMLGQVGEGLEFLMFRNRNSGGFVVDPKKEGGMEASFFGSTFRWRLPLGILLPAKKDGKTGELFPGNYSFNPFTGDRLVDVEEAVSANE